MPRLFDEINDDADVFIEAITNYRDIRRWMIKESAYCSTLREGLLFYRLAQEHEPDIIFESGTAVGWSSFWWAMGSDCRVLTWDVVARECIWDHERVTRFIAPFVEKGIEFIKQDQSKKKLVFLDADHSYKSIKEEFDAVVPLMKNGDLLVFHDTTTEHGVVKLIAEIEKAYPAWNARTYPTRNGVTTFEIVCYE